MLSSRKFCCSTIRSFTTTVKVFGKLGIVSCAFNLSVQRQSRRSPEWALASSRTVKATQSLKIMKIISVGQ